MKSMTVGSEVGQDIISAVVLLRSATLPAVAAIEILPEVSETNEFIPLLLNAPDTR